MLQFRLINPNSDERITAAMAAVARQWAPFDVQIKSTTSLRAAPLITNARELEQATGALLDLFEQGLDPLDGVVVAAFGDPGVEALRARVHVPVIGIAEAAVREASAYRKFAICTTTPALADAMRARVAALGQANALACVLTTAGDPKQLMADAAALDVALSELVETAVYGHGARAVVIGGGPLALASRRLAPISPVPLIEPVPAAVRCLCTELISPRRVR
jgi:allantoin racemase